MGRPRSAPQPALFSTPRRPPGRVERALTRATNAALKDGDLTDRDRPLVELARAAAGAVDVAQAAGDAYAIAAASREYTNLLVKLGLGGRPSGPAPEDSGDNNDGLRELLDFVRTPS